MGEVQTGQGYSNNTAFEQIWTILQETAKRQEEYAKRQEEWQEERAKRQEEWQEERAKQQKGWQEERAKQQKGWQEERAKQQKEWQEERAKQQKEWQEEHARRQEEHARRQEEHAKRQEEHARRQKEFDRDVKEAKERHKELDRIVKENAKLISGLGGRYGEMIEYMVKPTLVNKFNELGFVFTKVYPDTVIKDEKNKILAQVDMTLENGDKVMIVEVKSKPSIEDIKDHIERMEKLRRHADLHDDKRKYLGAVAGMVINDNERDFILKNGFYLVEPSGETFVITSPKGEPKEW